MAMPGSAARLPYLVATAHSPAPVGATPMSPVHRAGNAAIRAASPLQGQHVMIPAGGQLPSQMRPKPEGGFAQPAFMTPRMASRPRSPDPKAEAAGSGGTSPPAAGAVAGDVRQPAWAFRAERQGSHDGEASPAPGEPQGRTIRTSSPMAARALSPQILQGSRAVAQGGINFQAQGRVVTSPMRSQGHVFHMPARSLSPVHVVQQVAPGRSNAIRTASPVTAVRQGGGGGFSWTQVGAPFSPREGSPVGAPRAASPMAMPAGVGFSFKPDPPSPRLLSRNASPPHGAITFPKAGVTLPAGGASNRSQGQVKMVRSNV